jgi:hypothetical protein
MTNCDYARHAGKKGPKDLSICLKKFQSTTKEEWARMCELEGGKLAEEPVKKKLTLEELREVRLKSLGC